MRVRVKTLVLVPVACLVFSIWPATLASASKSWPFGYTSSGIDSGIKQDVTKLFKVHNIGSVSCVPIKSFRRGNVFHCTAYNDANVLIGRVTVKILKGNEENVSWKPTPAEAAATKGS
jgi:hypothetical protein